VRCVRFPDKCPIVRNCSALKLTAKLLARQPIHLGEGPRRVLAHENRNEEKLRLVSGRQNNNKKDKTDNMKTSSASSGGVNETRARSIQHPTSNIPHPGRKSNKCVYLFANISFPVPFTSYLFLSAHSSLGWEKGKGKSRGTVTKVAFPKTKLYNRISNLAPVYVLANKFNLNWQNIT